MLLVTTSSFKVQILLMILFQLKLKESNFQWHIYRLGGNSSFESKFMEF